MASSEDSIYQAAKAGLTRWLAAAKSKVLASWKNFGAQPSADSIFAADPVWQGEVDRIIAALTPALREGWSAAHLPKTFDINDPYIQTNLALTRNLLVRVPDEAHSLVVAAILSGTSRGETNAQIAARIDDILNYTGSENWDSRAKLIAQTELTRHYNSSLLAHALLAERQDNTPMAKSWETRTDGRERTAHRLADHQTVPIGQPYLVDGEQMMFPCDPNGSPGNVCGCRCGQLIKPIGSSRMVSP
jgi:hypothetical protein